MIRKCTGLDGTLTMFVDPVTGRRLLRETLGEVAKPCDCGTTFDDALRSTIWPHLRVTRGVA